MKQLLVWLGACVFCAGMVQHIAAQEPRLSPRDSVFLKLDTNVISVTYSRPSMRGRTIMGALVPWNTVWRTGANEATVLRTSFDMVIGGVPLTRGRYTLWSIPRKENWTLIINKQTGQWGTRYDEGQDYARFAATVEEVKIPMDTFTIALDRTGPSSGVLKLMWENTVVSTPFEMKSDIRPVSPLDSASAVIGNATVSVRYSKPFARGRRIWGVVVPWDSVWRTGANAATVLSTNAGLLVGGVAVPAGTYTLYSIPTVEALTLIVSKKAPGEASYDDSMDLARIPMRADRTAHNIDPFTIWLDKEGDGATLKLGWADRVFDVPIVPQ